MVSIFWSSYHSYNSKHKWGTFVPITHELCSFKSYVMQFWFIHDFLRIAEKTFYYFLELLYWMLLVFSMYYKAKHKVWFALNSSRSILKKHHVLLKNTCAYKQTLKIKKITQQNETHLTFSVNLSSQYNNTQNRNRCTYISDANRHGLIGFCLLNTT